MTECPRDLNVAQLLSYLDNVQMTDGNMPVYIQQSLYNNAKHIPLSDSNIKSRYYMKSKDDTVFITDEKNEYNIGGYKFDHKDMKNYKCLVLK